MSKPSAGTFSDFKIVRGRKVAQLVIEVPLEKANEVLAALGGVPQPADPRSRAILHFVPGGVGQSGSMPRG